MEQSLESCPECGASVKHQLMYVHRAWHDGAIRDASAEIRDRLYEDVREALWTDCGQQAIDMMLVDKEDETERRLLQAVPWLLRRHVRNRYAKMLEKGD
jgi:hypothetical protein